MKITLILIFAILNPAFYSDDFTISTELAWTLTIALGIALVAGRKRVPSPATGNTALRTRAVILSSLD